MAPCLYCIYSFYWKTGHMGGVRCPWIQFQWDGEGVKFISSNETKRPPNWQFLQWLHMSLSLSQLWGVFLMWWLFGFSGHNHINSVWIDSCALWYQTGKATMWTHLKINWYRNAVIFAKIVSLTSLEAVIFITSFALVIILPSMWQVCMNVWCYDIISVHWLITLLNASKHQIHWRTEAHRSWIHRDYHHSHSSDMGLFKTVFNTCISIAVPTRFLQDFAWCLTAANECWQIVKPQFPSSPKVV